MSRAVSESLETYGTLRLGDTVTVPGHGRHDPASVGTLTELTRLVMPRSVGIFATVTTEDGRTIRTAVGLVSKVAP